MHVIESQKRKRTKKCSRMENWRQMVTTNRQYSRNPPVVSSCVGSFYLHDLNYFSHRRHHASIPAPRLELDGLPSPQWSERYSSRRNGTSGIMKTRLGVLLTVTTGSRQNTANDFFPRVPQALPPDHWTSPYRCS